MSGRAGRYLVAFGAGLALAAAPGAGAVVGAATTSVGTGDVLTTSVTTISPGTGIASGGDTPTPGNGSGATTTTTTATTTTTTTPPTTSTATSPAPVGDGDSAPAHAVLPGVPPTRAGALRKRPQHPAETHTKRPVVAAHTPRARGKAVHRSEPAAATPEIIVAPEPLTVWDGGFSIDPFTASQLARFSAMVANFDQPPTFLVPIYKAASKRCGIPWQILASINAVETDYGRDLAVSPSGAIGWMQFMPGTWLEYGMNADGRLGNPYDPHDAIFAAARLLAANGAPLDMPRALFAYNHALWYVDAVLWRAQTISDRAVAADGRAGTNGYALPLDAKYMVRFGRTDDGVDIEDAPDGAAVYSIASGVVTAVASDPSGFGPDYPVILVTEGPLAGQSIYYGHVAASLVRVGQQVVAGEPIAVMGHTGNAASLGHGHIEIGFSDGSGTPLNRGGGPSGWTPSGDAMRHVLVALAAAFGLKVS